MFITRLLLILLGLWLVRQVLRLWRQPRAPEESPAEPESSGPSPFDNQSIHDADYEEVDEDREAGGEPR